MSGLEEEYYDFSEFMRQMREATDILKKMRVAAQRMRWQYEMDSVFKEFESELDDAKGWLSSWCG